MAAPVGCNALVRLRSFLCPALGLAALTTAGPGVVVGIVCISVNVCRRKIRLAQFDFELKRDMLQRGLSAEEIRTVIEAGRPAVPDHDRRACSDQRRETQSWTHK